MTESGAENHGRLAWGKLSSSHAAGSELGTMRSVVGGATYGASSRISRRLLSPRHFLIFLLVVSIPLVNPWVHGDGVGYYAYLHSLLIEHNLKFEAEWREANSTFATLREDASGQLLASQYTTTGHIDNHFSVGPAILWAPAVVPVHVALLALQRAGVNVATDGYSRPYLWAMALATLAYGFAGLWLSFLIARDYAGETWAALAVVAYWFASSLPVYMYLNPSWSHAQSVFTAALFLWYWRRTRGTRTLAQWAWLGLAAGLMVNVYYLNAILLLLPSCESLRRLWLALRGADAKSGTMKILTGDAVFALVFAMALLPTFITRKIIYGSYFSSGYPDSGGWNWLHPVFGQVLFSSDHGLLTWTPVIVLALVGLVFLRRFDRELAIYFWIATASFTYVISCYGNWDGISSFGNRFFLSLGPIFVVGLAAFFERFGRLFKSERRAIASAVTLALLFIAWNIGFIFQWGAHMVPVRGAISWSTMIRNQFTEVPSRVWTSGEEYLLRRKNLLKQVEQRDLQEIRKHEQPPH
jgi:hypothetical protein